MYCDGSRNGMMERSNASHQQGGMKYSEASVGGREMTHTHNVCKG